MISESQTSHCRNHTWEQQRLAVHILLSKLSKEEGGVVDSAGSAAGIPSCPKRDVKVPSTPHYRKYHFIPRNGSDLNIAGLSLSWIYQCKLDLLHLKILFPSFWGTKELLPFGVVPMSLLSTGRCGGLVRSELVQQKGSSLSVLQTLHSKWLVQEFGKLLDLIFRPQALNSTARAADQLGRSGQQAKYQPRPAHAGVTLVLCVDKFSRMALGELQHAAVTSCRGDKCADG